VKLFAKIFLSYWLATALFVVLAIMLTMAMRPPGEITSIQAMQPKLLADGVQAYQGGGPEALHKYMRGIHEAQHVHLYLFGDQGQDLGGRKTPPWITQVLNGQTRTADSVWGRFGPTRFLRSSATLADGHIYTLVIEFPPEPGGPFGPHGFPGLGILIAVLTSGLVCYFLARYVTTPVVRLREATRRLASGDLTARAGVSRGHDEIAELVRDFDRMAERIESLVNAQSRLLNDISHELRSPLARLNVALDLLRRKTGPEAQNSIDRIEREADRLNELIGRLLTIARLEAGNNSMQGARIGLRELIQEIVQDADFEAQSRNCHVRFAAGDECCVQGDSGLLRSAVENVVRNAICYTAEHTDVHVRLECAENSGQAVIAIADSGPGVPEDALDKLFRPFYRLDDSRMRETGGVGLGLSITERAVRLHGGSVRAMNRPQGGLVVEIRLPVIPSPPAAPDGVKNGVLYAG